MKETREKSFFEPTLTTTQVPASPFSYIANIEMLKTLKTVQTARSIGSQRWQSTVAPFRIAVIGSGPAGFYTALRVLEKLPMAKVDMYESLPVPFGLARFGVAPDHPEVKVCQERFDDVAASPNFKFIGNTRVGTDVSLRDLRENYNSLVFAYGSSEDRTLGIPGENLAGVYSARQFVGWYNGLPEHVGLNPPLPDAEDVTIIGNGNVALDVARILLCDLSRLKSTDITEEAYETLKGSKVKNVRIVGRRGLLQSAFTTKEVRELVNEPGVALRKLEESYIETYRPFIPVLDRIKKRLIQVINKASSEWDATAAEKNNLKTWSLDYLLSPTQFNAAYYSDKLLESTRFEVNVLEQDDIKSPAIADGTGQYVTFKNELVFRSIGYKSVALPGLREELGVNFDERRGVIPNSFGRILVNATEQNKVIPGRGLYATGWVKTGPTGVIAHTMRESFEVAETIFEDYYKDNVDKDSKAGFEGVTLKNRAVSWKDWEKIDAAEKELGKALGKPRSKLTSVEGMLSVL